MSLNLCVYVFNKFIVELLNTWIAFKLSVSHMQYIDMIIRDKQLLHNSMTWHFNEKKTAQKLSNGLHIFGLWYNEIKKNYIEHIWHNSAFKLRLHFSLHL